ncbi:MAG: Na+/H+ antiporter NhaC family protein [Desulfobacterium sp.]
MEQVIDTLKTHRTLKSNYISVIIVGLVCLCFWFLAANHNPDEAWGAISMLPTILVLVVALYSRKPFESLLAGAVIGLIMVNKAELITPFCDSISSVVGDETIVWVVLVCGLMGGLITLLELSGCLGSFSQWLQGKIKTEKQALVTTFIIGLVVFVDDYLNCLAVSSSVKKLTDHYKISREKLAFIIDSTAAPMCVIVPISTWAVFFAGLLEENGLAEAGKGISLYISAIPYMAYGWSALLVVFLVAIGVIGDFGPMKKAEERAKAGQPIPDDFVGRELKIITNRSISVGMGMLNFAIPMILLIGATVYYDIDLLKGVVFTLGVTIVLYYIQGLLTFNEQIEGLFTGFKIMFYPLATVIAGFLLKDVNDKLGMTEYVINAVTPYMTQGMLPAIVFLVMALVVFGTASSWGVFIIAIPIVVPIALSVDANMPLVIGALLSAASFGSHACFFSDSTVLAAQGAGCSPMSHAFTQIPYALIGATFTLITFLILGFTIG